MAERRTQETREALVRRMLDSALIDAPEDVYATSVLNPPLALASRIVLAFSGEGLAFVRSTGWKRSNGRRGHMEFEDLVEMALCGCGAKVIRLMNSGDSSARQAGRDYVARSICRVLHEHHVILKRRTGAS